MFNFFKALTLLAFLINFSACSGPSSSKNGDKNASKSTKAKKDSFIYNIGSEPKTLNPVTSQDYYGTLVQNYVLDRMLYRDPDTYEWRSNIAESYEISPDGMSFTFKIRKNAKFHDGNPVTAHDVKFSVDVIFMDEYGVFSARPYYENVKNSEVINEHTIKFTASEKYFKSLEVLGNLTIVPKHIYKDPAKGKKLNKTMIGSGPYLIKKYEKGRRIILERNPDWWGNSLPEFENKYQFKEVVLKFVKESNVAIQMLKKAQLNLIAFRSEDYVKKTDGPEWNGRLLKVKTENKKPKSYGFIGWNFKNKMFNSKNVRRALAHLMNRDEMNQKFNYGLSLPASGPWYLQSPYANESVKAIAFDPKKASELLKADGWADTDKDGTLDKVIDGQKTKFEFTLLYSNKESEKYFVLYQRDLEKAGIKMRLQNLEWNAFLPKVQGGEFDACALGWNGGTVDNDPKQIWHSSSAVKGGSNFIGYKNPTVDKMIDEARKELDKSKRIVLLKAVYKAIADDAPYAFMFVPKYSLYGVSGFVDRPKDTFTYELGEKYWSVKSSLVQ